MEKDKNNFEALQTMGEAMRTAVLFLASNDYCGRTLQRSEVKANLSTREAIMADMGLNSLEVKDGKQAADTFEKCLKEFLNSPHKAEWVLNLGRAYAIAEKKDKANKVLATA